MLEIERKICEAEENVQDVSLKEITKETLATILPELAPCEIEFYGRCEDEVGGSVDYVYGGLKDTYMANEEDKGYITIEHIYTADSTAQEPDEWTIECYWSTDHFEVKESAHVDTVEDVYDFILGLQDYFNDFDLERIYW